MTVCSTFYESTIPPQLFSANIAVIYFVPNYVQNIVLSIWGLKSLKTQLLPSKLYIFEKER